MKKEDVIRKLKSLANPANAAGMARYGISTKGTLGVSVPVLRGIAKEIGKDHKLAGQLWASGIHDARLLAGFIDDPERVSEAQMERWARGFDSWDVCDLVNSDLFDKTRYAWRKAVEWSRREEEFVKRSGFVLMAALAVHDKAAPDSAFRKFLPIIRRESWDDRNFVRKAVNWALRNIGKRNARLNRAAVSAAKHIRSQGSRSARWIASDALRELTSGPVQKRLARHETQGGRS